MASTAQLRAAVLRAADDPDAAADPAQQLAVAAWGGFVFVARRRPATTSLRSSARSSIGCALPARRPPARAHVPLRRGGQLEGDRRELQRVLPLRPGAPGALRSRAGVPARRRGLHWTDGIPHRDGRLDVHDDGHVGTPAVRRARRGGADTTQGRAGLPESAAQPQRRTRRRHRLDATRTGADDHRVRSAVPPRRVGVVLVRPVRRRRPVGSRQSPGLGDVRARPAGHDVAGWHGGWFAPMEDESADITRWYRR